MGKLHNLSGSLTGKWEIIKATGFVLLLNMFIINAEAQGLPFWVQSFMVIISIARELLVSPLTPVPEVCYGKRLKQL